MGRWYNKYAEIVLCSIVGFGLYELVPWHKMDVSAWAAWVQAVGSIFAILVAIWVGHRQSEGARKQAHEMDMKAVSRRHDAIRAILDEAYAQCLRVAPEFAGGLSFHTLSFMFFNERSFDDAISTLEKIPLHELDSYELVSGISGLRDRMISIKQVVIRAKDVKRNREEEPDSQLSSVGEDICEEAGVKYRVALAVLGGDPITEEWALWGVQK
ncbi:MAG TPA: hypothetical protein VM571_07175 [Noviherbaspirillum sp.]|nr:hypothetical protein [Noviherbaspirillum sp.]